jgi:hypothetical protein
MKRRCVMLILVGCAVVAAVAFLMWSPGEQEPVYRGKRLSEWIAGEGAVSREVVLGVTEREDIVRMNAVRHIGTNAVPFLVKWIESAEIPERSRIQLLVMRANRGAGQALEDFRLRNLKRAADAEWAFTVLWYDGRAALPDLIRLSESTNGHVSYFARLARGTIETATGEHTNGAGVILGQ